jgi:uncharacterized protein (TIGR00251 family)
VEVRASSDGAGHVEFSVHVRTCARRASLGGEHGGALDVRVRSAPVDGAANDEVVASVARALGLRSAEVVIVSGAKARRKRLRAHGEPALLRARLLALAARDDAV